MKKLNKKGFTIVELVIVIAVIAILAAVLIPTFSGVVDKANESKALQEAKNAYTLALAEALEDGKIIQNEVIKLDAKGIKVDTGEKWTITFGTAESVDATITSTDYSNYTFKVFNGVYSCTKKAL